MHQRRGFLQVSMPDLNTADYLASTIGSVLHGFNQLCRGSADTLNAENMIQRLNFLTLFRMVGLPL